MKKIIKALQKLKETSINLANQDLVFKIDYY